MATRGMSEFRADGVDYTVNDPNIAKEFDATAANAKGDYVNYQGDLYRFTAAHTANTAWGSRSKTKVELGADVKALEDGKVPSTRTVNGHALSANVTVTKGDVGLGNVDNTSDANKPVSTATAAAIALKIDKANIENDLTGTTAGYVLDARQGKVLDDKVTGLKNAICKEFDPTKAYKNGEYAIFNGVTYKFIMDRPAGTWDSGYCVEADITDDIYKNQNNAVDLIDALKDDIGIFESFVPYVLDDGVYDVNMNLNTGVNGNHLTATVKGDHKYIIAGYRWVKSYPAVLFLNGSTLIGFYNGDTELNERFTDLEINTPADCNKVIINGTTAGYDTGAPMIKEVNILPSDIVFEAADFETEAGVYSSSYSLNTAVGIHSVYDVEPGDIIRYSAYKYANSYPVLLFKNEGSFVGYTLGDVLSTSRQRNYYFIVPYGVDQIVVQCDSLVRINIEKAVQGRQVTSWKGKNILFLGTSISATGTTFRDEYYTIPGFACRLLGANAIVRAKGESMARNGFDFAKTETDPYGWTGAYWNNVAYSLSMTLSEKNELITNWETKWRDLLIGDNKPQNLTDEIKEQWRGCSYENRLLPFLDGTETKPDLIVIEHGRNDVAWWDESADAFSGVPSVNPDSVSGFNRGLYGDAMAYLIRIIREYLRDVPIMIVGHFDNSGAFVDLPTEQEKAAKYNGVFFCDTTPTGWNDCKVNVTGQWVNGYWVEDGVSRVYTRRHQNMPDDIHPASALSGEAIMIEAGIIANFILSNIVPQI